MLFTSYSFVLFSLAVAAVYYIVPAKWQNALLFGASCWFYWYTMPKFLPLQFLFQNHCGFFRAFLSSFSSENIYMKLIF